MEMTKEKAIKYLKSKDEVIVQSRHITSPYIEVIQARI